MATLNIGQNRAPAPTSLRAGVERLLVPPGYLGPWGGVGGGRLPTRKYTDCETVTLIFTYQDDSSQRDLKTALTITQATEVRISVTAFYFPMRIKNYSTRKNLDSSESMSSSLQSETA